jgi:hypothetical protein
MAQQLLKKVGYGQVEKNRIQGIRAGRVLADLPVKPEVVKSSGDRIENGMFLDAVYGTGFEGNLKTGQLELPTAQSKNVGLVYSEVKLYSEYTSNKDFALFTVNPSINQMRQAPIYDKKEAPKATVIPRLIFPTPGDIFTTNLIETENGELPEVGTTLKLNDKGILSTAGTLNVVIAQVVQKTTMADGQVAAKLAIVEVNPAATGA